MMKKFDWVRDLIIFLLSVSAILMNAGRWVNKSEMTDEAVMTKLNSLQHMLEIYITENNKMHEHIPAEFVTKENLDLRLKNIELKIDNLALKTR